MISPRRRLVAFGVAAVTAIAILGFASPQARADLDIGEVTDMLAEDSGSNMALFGYHNGPDASATLSFTSFVTGTGFSYATDPNQTYFGQAFSLSGSGTFNDISQTWTMSSSGFYGGTALTILGMQTRTVNPAGYYQIISDYDYYENGVKKQDLHINLKIFPPIPSDPYWRSNDMAYFTDETGAPIPGAQYISFDKYLPGTGNWDIDIYNPFPQPPKDLIVSVDGNSPGIGGVGTFDATFAAVPEPSSFALLSIAALGMGLAARRKARRSSAL